MAHSVTIEATATALNQYCTAFAPKINQNLKQDLEFERFLPFVTCERTWVEPNITVGNILQPYQSAFTPNNTESFDAVENTLEHGKADLEFTADQLEKFYDAWACNWFELGKNPTEWNYPRYIIENHILPQLIEDMNLASWAGERVNPTPGTAGTYLQTWDGFKKKIADAITAGKLTPVTSGAIVAADIVEQIRDWVRDLPVPYRYAPGTIFMSITNQQYYADAYSIKHPRASQIVENPDMPYLNVDHMRKKIVGLNCMEGSDRWIFFPEVTQNMIIGTRTGQPVYPQLRFEPFERKLKVMSEVSRFYGFRFWDHLFVNDQA